VKDLRDGTVKTCDVLDEEPAVEEVGLAGNESLFLVLGRREFPGARSSVELSAEG
jgi:hypothetical protein